MNRKVFSLLSVLALISCSEHEMLTAPQPTLAPARPRNLSAALPGFQGWLSGIPGSTLTLDPYPYAEGVRVAFSITGSIDIGSNGTYAYYVTRDWTLDA